MIWPPIKVAVLCIVAQPVFDFLIVYFLMVCPAQKGASSKFYIKQKPLRFIIVRA